MDGERRSRSAARRRAAVALVVVSLAGSLVAATAALAARSFSDTLGDNNAAPDVTALSLSETPDGILTISLAVANYQALPPRSSLNVWFDLDNNQRTGDEGDEALVQYFDDGGIQFYRWSGSELVRRPTTGMSGSFAAGALTLTVPKSALDTVASFGVLAISVRAQPDGDGGANLASDYLPNGGNSLYVAPGPFSIADPAGDQDAAPDITKVDVSDTKAGTLRFTISTPSHATLPAGTWIELDFDLDRRGSTGSRGVDAYVGLDHRQVYSAWWDAGKKKFVRVPRAGVTARNSGGVVTLSVPRRFLRDVAKFDFYLVSGDSFGEDDNAIDLAPNGDRWWQYTLAHRPPLRLVAGTPAGTPRRPAAGRRFQVAVPVLRSDTARAITSGSAACDVRVAGKRVRASGAIAGGAARCSLVIPAGASGAVLRGTMTVRSGGKSVTARFTFPVQR